MLTQRNRALADSNRRISSRLYDRFVCLRIAPGNWTLVVGFTWILRSATAYSRSAEMYVRGFFTAEQEQLPSAMKEY
jgi:hypothetical protein